MAATTNRIFTPEMIEHLRTVLTVEPQTTLTVLADMIAVRWGVAVLENQVRSIIHNRWLPWKACRQAPNPIEASPEIKQRITEVVCGDNPPTNFQMTRLVFDEFGLRITNNQVAGFLHRAGLNVRGARSGPRRTNAQIEAARIAEAKQFIGKVAASMPKADAPKRLRLSTARVVTPPGAPPRPALPPQPSEVVWRAPAPPPDARTCLWPDACDEPVWDKRSYCLDHCRISYVGFKAEVVSAPTTL